MRKVSRAMLLAPMLVVSVACNERPDAVTGLDLASAQVLRVGDTNGYCTELMVGRL